MLCSVVCVLACGCSCCCRCRHLLVMVIGVSAQTVSVAPVLSFLLVSYGIKWSLFFSLSLSLPPRPHSLSRPRVLILNVSVCTFKTSPCMPAPRAHVFQHVGVVRYTRGRFERTHGDVLNLHTVFSSVSHHTPHRTHTTIQDTRHYTQQHTETETEREKRK